GGDRQDDWLPNGVVRPRLHRTGLGARFRGLLGDQQGPYATRQYPRPHIEHLVSNRCLADEGVGWNRHRIGDPRSELDTPLDFKRGDCDVAREWSLSGGRSSGRGVMRLAATRRPNLPALGTCIDLTVSGAGYRYLQAVTGIRSPRSRRSQPGRYPDR